jgi:cyclopropane fatty-acyl-phospholipid synthase-like methyltransferase
MNAAAGTNPLHHPRYLRSNAYDPKWVIENQMGPNPLWAMESLTETLPIRRGMRVLDLGCGTAMTSIFLAKEFGAHVWATDLWVGASANLARIRDAGVEDLVVPIYSDAHQLPFARDFFDVILSVGAYHYFGTADLYLGYITDFLRKAGQIGIVAPGLRTEFGADVPAELASHWQWDFCAWHGPNWWRTHWEKTRKVDVQIADMVEHGWQDWLRFEEASGPHLEGWRKETSSNNADMLLADQGRNLGFSRIVATKP